MVGGPVVKIQLRLLLLTVSFIVLNQYDTKSEHIAHNMNSRAIFGNGRD
jgi:hypothetical protein